jgi:cysteine desulfurase/selenocysteine lyase
MSELTRRSFLKATATAAGLASLPASSGVSAPSMDEDPLGVRAEFPIAQNLAYLNTSAVAPIPRAVREAGIEYLDGKMLQASAARNSERREQARSRFARLFGTKPEELALLYATSDGENIVTSALDLKPGDNVVIDDLHFVTSFVLYRQLEKDNGVELRIVRQREGRARLEDFDAAIDGRTSLVSVAWVSNRNGYRHDLRKLSELAHSKGALLYTDAIQALGYFPTSLTEQGVDFVCTGAYKWLLSSFGVAPFYVREEHLDRIRPDRYGHAQVTEELPDLHYRLEKTAKKYEYAALAYSAVYQLNAGLAFLENVGLSRIETHTVALARRLRDGITKLGFDPFTPSGNDSPIVSFVHGHDPKDLARRLEKEGVVVTLREGGDVLRAGIALFNNESDIQRLLSVIETIA